MKKTALTTRAIGSRVGTLTQKTKASMIDTVARLHLETMKELLIEESPSLTKACRTYATSLVEGVMRSRYTKPPKIVASQNTRGINSLSTMGPYKISLFNPNQLVVEHGSVFIGVLPSVDGYILTNADMSIMIDYVFSLPASQEDAVSRLIDKVVDATQPLGAAVRLVVPYSAHGAQIITEPYGEMINSSLLQEFMQECNNLRVHARD